MNNVTIDYKALLLLLTLISGLMLIPLVTGFGERGELAAFPEGAAIVNVVVIALVLGAESISVCRITKQESFESFGSRTLAGTWSAVFLILFGVCPPILDAYHLRWFRLETDYLIAVGWILMSLGALLRFKAIHDLRGYFNHSLRLFSTHQIIRSGLYSLVRHPAYAGTLVMYTGFSLMYKSYVAFLLIWLVFAYVFARIKEEEAMMEEKFGSAYSEYKDATYMLVPFIY